ALSLHNRTRRSASLPSVTATSGCLLLSLSASPLLSWAASPPYEVIGKRPCRAQYLVASGRGTLV
ncbi:MAG: hypothetical protein IKR48_07000, partial [Kiritimatiellae bacterium]|nr:hypothetical protein [Kiritimatiellia bacterium]